MRAYPVAIIADSLAMRISQASASASPAPAAGPGSAAIVGLRTATSAPVKVRCLVRRSATRSSKAISALLLLLPMPLTSPPAQKAVPAPDISSAPTFGSSPHCLIIRRSAGVRWSESALRASGRLSVMSATRSRISHNSSPVPVSISIRPSAISTAPIAAGDARLRHGYHRPFTHREGSCDLQRCLAFRADESRQPIQDDALGICHDTVDQFLDRRNVLDQADHHAAAPGAGIHLAVDLDQAVDALVLQYALGVPKGPHHQPGVEFGRGHQRLLDVIMHRRLLGG